MLKAFAAASAPSNTLAWERTFDQENGAGVTIALLDSGINWSHPIFDGARIRGRDFTGAGDLFDPTGHGTANASLIVGQGPGAAFGVSHGSDLLVAKVLGRGPRWLTERAIAAAIRWAVYKKADIIALPFGSMRGARTIYRQIRRAAQKGCLLFAAAGNHGPENIRFPAWLPEVTAVSALSFNGEISPHCCSREEVNLYAWGDGVPALGLAGRTTLYGSSPATVLAAGCAALKVAAVRNAHATRTIPNKEKEVGQWWTPMKPTPSH